MIFWPCREPESILVNGGEESCCDTAVDLRISAVVASASNLFWKIWLMASFWLLSRKFLADWFNEDAGIWLDDCGEIWWDGVGEIWLDGLLWLYSIFTCEGGPSSSDDKLTVIRFCGSADCFFLRFFVGGAAGAPSSGDLRLTWSWKSKTNWTGKELIKCHLEIFEHWRPA